MFIRAMPYSLPLVILALVSQCAKGEDLAILDTKHPYDYGVVIDAGSTGSRLHIFRWYKRVYNLRRFGEVVGSHLSLPEDVGSYVTTPGVSAFLSDLSQLERSLTPLLAKAEEHLRNISHHIRISETQIYMGGTAGMRVLSEHVLHPVLEEARRVLRKSNFNTDYHSNVRVLSGEEEGAFGWLCVNSGRPEGITSDPLQTMGVVDLGGASAQISFLPSGPSLKASLFPMHFGNFLRDGPIHMYAHSFLDFGYVTAWHQLGHKLASTNPQVVSEEILHPCLPPGTRWNVTAVDFGLSVVSDNAEMASGPVHFVGTGNVDACADLARSLVSKEYPCFFQGECSFLGEYQPPKGDTKFAVIGEYANAYRGLDVDPTWTLRERLAFLRSFCLEPEAVQRQYGERGGYRGTAASLICWIATWSVVLLHDGLKFDLDSSSLVWNQSLWGGETSWAKGKILYETNFFPWYIASGMLVALPPISEPTMDRGSNSQRWLGWRIVEALGLIAFGNILAWVPASLRRCTQSRRASLMSQPLLE